MHEAGHELALAVLTEESDDLSRRFQKISSICKNGYTLLRQLPIRNNLIIQSSALLKNRLFPIERYDCKDFREKLSVLINSFQPDVVHFDIITMSQYRDTVPSGIGTIASINDSYSLTLENLLKTGQYSGFQYIYRKWQLYQTRKYEASAYVQFDKVHVMSEVDAAYLNKLNPVIDTSIIPNGVNPALFDIAAHTFEQRDVIFVAQLVGENLHSLQKFLETSWPIVIKKCPEAKLFVVGRLSCEAMQVKDYFANSLGVIFTDYIEHLENIYAKCGIAVVPINKNCGIVNKAIEAMVSGLAVIGFEKAFSGIKEADAGVHYISVSDYHDMGDAVAELILDKPRCQAIKKAAHALAVNNYSWSSRAEAYGNMYSQAAQHARVA